LAPVAVLALVATTRREDFLASPSADRWLEGAGIVAVGVGLAIRALVMATSLVRRSGVHKRVVAPTLYDEGPYAWCRNPLYLGNGIILIGLTMLFDSRWMAWVALPTALLLIRCIVAAEERVLSESFGPYYRDYCRRVPRFFPRRLLSIAALGPLDWRRALRKEHGPAFAAITTLVVLATAKNFSRMGSAAWHWREPTLLAVWVVAAVLWARVRHLKRTGRLQDPSVPIAAAENPLGHIAA
jgi:protein-S-isoprenylcysteine O-methyltransferase Ste14